MESDTGFFIYSSVTKFSSQVNASKQKVSWRNSNKIIIFAAYDRCTNLEGLCHLPLLPISTCVTTHCPTFPSIHPHQSHWPPCLLPITAGTLPTSGLLHLLFLLPGTFFLQSSARVTPSGLSLNVTFPRCLPWPSCMTSCISVPLWTLPIILYCRFGVCLGF